MLSSFYDAQTIVEVFTKNTSTIDIYSTSASTNFHPIEDPFLTSDKWNEIKKYAYKVAIGNVFQMLDNASFDSCVSLLVKKHAQRQFLIFNITSIDGIVEIRQIFTRGTDIAPIINIV